MNESKLESKALTITEWTRHILLFSKKKRFSHDFKVSRFLTKLELNF